MPEKSEYRPRDRWLIYSFVVGPLAALSQQSVMYVLVPSACAQRSNFMLHIATAVFLLIALTGTLIAWRYLAAFREARDELWKERTYWVAAAAVTLSLGSMLVIVAQELPNLILRSCQ